MSVAIECLTPGRMKVCKHGDKKISNDDIKCKHRHKERSGKHTCSLYKSKPILVNIGLESGTVCGQYQKTKN